MSKTVLLLRYKMKQAIRKLLDVKNEPLLKKIVISLFVLSYLTGGFFFLYKFFYFINAMTPVGEIVLDRLFYVYFFILFIMLIVSTMIISYSSFFKTKETESLFYLPVSPGELWLYKFIEVTLMSSWAFIFLSVPVILAFGMVKKASMAFYLLTFISIFPFVVISSSLGVAILFLFLRFVPRKYTKHVLFGCMALMVYTIYSTIPKGTYYESTNVVFILNTLLRHTDMTLQYFLPSMWEARQLLLSLDRQYGWFFFFFLIAFSNALFIAVNLYAACSFSFRGIYTSEKSVSVRRFRRDSAAGRAVRKVLDVLFPQKYSAVIVKDFVTFLRDPMQWSQFLVFFGLIFLYTVNLRNMRYDLDDPFWKNLISFFNLGAVCLTTATLNTRFIFPLISMEGRRIWILGMIPGRRREIVHIKFIYTAALSMLMVIPLTLLSNYIIHSSPWIYFLSLTTGVLTSLTLSAMSVGLGAMYPNFKAESPSEIVSGFGGTLVLVLSIMYIIIIVGLEGYISHIIVMMKVVRSAKWSLFLTGLLLIVATSFIASFLSLRSGIRNIERMDF